MFLLQSGLADIVLVLYYLRLYVIVTAVQRYFPIAECPIAHSSSSILCTSVRNGDCCAEACGHNRVALAHTGLYYAHLYVMVTAV